MKKILRSLEIGYVETVDINTLAYQKDETILIQTNQEIEDQLSAITIDLRSNDQLQQAALATGDAAELIKLQKLRQQMNDAQNDLERRQANLMIRTPYTGIFETNLNSLAHTNLSPGGPIGIYIDTSVYKVVIDIL